MVLLVPLLWSLIPSVRLFGVEFTCPETFRDGVNIVTCKINMTAIKEADCSSLQPFVTFDRTVHSVTLTKCFTPTFNSSACNHIQEADANSCWCDKLDGEIFYYMFAYKANHTQDVGTHLQCKVCTSPNNHLNEEISDHCKNLTFDKAENCDNTDNKENSLILPIILPVIVIIIIIFFGVFFACFKHKDFLKSTGWCTSPVAEMIPLETESQRPMAEKSEDKHPTINMNETLLKHSRNGTTPVST